MIKLEDYTKQGFSIFPCSSDRSPLTANGFYNATTDLELLKKQFYSDDILIGLPTGKVNKICVVDFDINKKIPGTQEIDTRTVEELKEAFEDDFGELPDTFEVKSQSGGRHFYYRLQDDYDGNVRSKNRYFDKMMPVDIRCEGGYVIAPDDKTYCIYDDVDEQGIDNLLERLAPLPQWIIDFKHHEEIHIPENTLPESEVREIRSALASLSSDDRDLWVQMGMALKSTGSPIAYGLWNEWSQTSDKYNPEDMERRWAGLKPTEITIASLFHEAKKVGWVSTYVDNNIPYIPTEELPTKEEIQHLKQEFKKKPFPEDLLSPPGLVGDIMDFILKKSFRPQPIFSLSAALCAVGTLAGRKYQTETGIRTNIYCLNVGKSGCGKEAPRKVIKDIFQEAKCGELASVEDLASDASIITELQKNPSQLFLIDEIGRFLNATKKGGVHLNRTLDVLLRFYGSTDQKVFGKSYADDSKKAHVMQPNLCLLGTTVPDNLYKGLDYESITDGFLSRVLIFETDDHRPKRNRSKDFLVKPSSFLIDQIKFLHKKPVNMNPNGDLDFMNPEPQIVYRTEGARRILVEFEDYLDDLMDKLEDENKSYSVYNRISQIAEQIALILAIGMSIENPQITEFEMKYGIELSRYLAEHMEFIIENYMAKNEFEHEVKRVLSIIRQAGTISISEISKRTQNLQSYVRNDILETLRVSKQIDIGFVGESEFAIKMFTAIK